MLKPGDKAPDFKMVADNGKTISLSSFKYKTLVLYFYPKDDTPGCTKEACAFRDNLPQFKKSDAVIIGVSKDNTKQHQKFKEKYDLNFPLATDEDGSVCGAYGVWKEKSMYGKKYMGIARTTFIIDGKGTITHIFENIKVDDHAEEVLEILK